MAKLSANPSLNSTYTAGGVTYLGWREVDSKGHLRSPTYPA